MTKRRLSRALALSCALLLAHSASAHDLNLARVSIQETDAGYALTAVAPARFADLRGEAARIEWPAPCVADGREVSGAGALVRIEARARCPEPPPADATIRVPWGGDGAVLETPDGPLILAARDGGLRLPLPGQARAVGTIVREYVALGVVHILEGWDHLAFVLCLFLLTSGVHLLWLVTAFTIGHSISLALAYLGFLDIPVPPTEAVIALSIAFMAREALAARARRKATDRRVLVVVALFGLLHGLGFASVLGDLGVATSERVSGLLAFNVGVEVGQLCFVATLAALWWTLERMRIAGATRSAALFGAGTLGAFWFVERVTGLIV